MTGQAPVTDPFRDRLRSLLRTNLKSAMKFAPQASRGDIFEFTVGAIDRSILAQDANVAGPRLDRSNRAKAFLRGETDEVPDLVLDMQENSRVTPTGTEAWHYGDNGGIGKDLALAPEGLMWGFLQSNYDVVAGITNLFGDGLDPRNLKAHARAVVDSVAKGRSFDESLQRTTAMEEARGGGGLVGKSAETVGHLASYLSPTKWMGKAGLAFAAPGKIFQGGSKVGQKLAEAVSKSLGSKATPKLFERMAEFGGGMAAMGFVTAPGSEDEDGEYEVLLADRAKRAAWDGFSGMVLGSLSHAGGKVAEAIMKKGLRNAGTREGQMLGAFKEWFRNNISPNPKAVPASQIKPTLQRWLAEGAPGAEMTGRRFAAIAAESGIEGAGFSFLHQEMWADTYDALFQGDPEALGRAMERLGSNTIALMALRIGGNVDDLLHWQRRQPDRLFPVERPRQTDPAKKSQDSQDPRPADEPIVANAKDVEGVRVDEPIVANAKDVEGVRVDDPAPDLQRYGWMASPEGVVQIPGTGMSFSVEGGTATPNRRLSRALGLDGPVPVEQVSRVLEIAAINDALMAKFMLPGREVSVDGTRWEAGTDEAPGMERRVVFGQVYERPIMQGEPYKLAESPKTVEAQDIHPMQREVANALGEIAIARRSDLSSEAAAILDSIVAVTSVVDSRLNEPMMEEMQVLTPEVIDALGMLPAEQLNQEILNIAKGMTTHHPSVLGQPGASEPVTQVQEPVADSDARAQESGTLRATHPPSNAGGHGNPEDASGPSGSIFGDLTKSFPDKSYFDKLDAENDAKLDRVRELNKAARQWEERWLVESKEWLEWERRRDGAYFEMKAKADADVFTISDEGVSRNAGQSPQMLFEQYMNEWYADNHPPKRYIPDPDAPPRPKRVKYYWNEGRVHIEGEEGGPGEARAYGGIPLPDPVREAGRVSSEAAAEAGGALVSAFSFDLIKRAERAGVKEPARWARDAETEGRRFMAKTGNRSRRLQKLANRKEARSLRDSIRYKEMAVVSRYTALKDADMGQLLNVSRDSMTPAEREIIEIADDLTAEIRRESAAAGMRRKVGDEYQPIDPEVKRNVKTRSDPTPEFRDMLQQKSGDAWERYVEVVADMNGMEPSEVKSLYREDRPLSNLDAIESQRVFKYMPDGIVLKDGSVLRLFKADPAEHVEGMLRRAAMRIGVSKSGFGQGIPKAKENVEAEEAGSFPDDGVELPYRDLINQVDKEQGRKAAKALADMVRGLHGIPLTAPTLEAGSSTQKFVRGYDAYMRLWKGMKLSASFTANLVEPMGTPAAWLGYGRIGHGVARFMNAMRGKNLEGLVQEGIENGWFLNDIPNWRSDGETSFEKFQDAMRIGGQGASIVFTLSQRFGELVVGAAASKMVADMQAGKGEPSDAAFVRRFGYGEAEAKSIASGKGESLDYDRIRMGAVPLLMGGHSQFSVNQSPLQQGRTFPRLWAFTQFVSKQINALHDAYRQIRPGQKSSYVPLLRFLAANVIAGTMVDMFARLLRDGIDGPSNYLREFSTSPGWTAANAAYNSVFGALGSYWKNLGGSFYDVASNVFAPMAVVSEISEGSAALFGAEDPYSRYNDKDAMGKAQVFANEMAPLVRVVSGWFMDDMSKAVSSYNRWRVLNIGGGFRDDSEAGDPDERANNREFLSKMRAAVKAIQEGEEIGGDEVIGRLIDAVGARGPDSARASLLSRRKLSGPRWDELSGSQQATLLDFLGEDQEVELRRHDAILESLADALR